MTRTGCFRDNIRCPDGYRKQERRSAVIRLASALVLFHFPESGTVRIIKHPFNVAFPIQDFSSEQEVGNPAVVAVVLERPPAYFQPLGDLPVREIPLTFEHRSAFA